ncbi:MAG TPA: hypothetical protein VJU79_00325, partial [Candidatus Dormibacteraeota bacterium]|nr:hypothetical protein [Candidatus Dormibacteraeota bacterium]
MKTRADSRTGGVRAMAHGVLRRGYRAIFGPKADDPARGWHGITPDGLPVVRMLYVGDCGFRQMDNGHQLRAPVGWPALAAERMAENGVGLEFSHSFAVLFEDLPDMETL